MATFLLDPDVTFLNHGSFGATPVELLQRQEVLRREMEREPVEFMVRSLPGHLARARARAARFLGADTADLAFVTNATAGANAVLGSLRLQPGDELLTTDHVYNAVRNAMLREAARAGARVVEVHVPFPLERPEQVTEAVIAGFGPRTRLLVLDQITSPTGMVWPMADILAAARAAGILTLVDGAHAPGQVPVDLNGLGADFWVGNLHKWLCAPKGAALLHVARAHQAWVHPPVISHGFGGGLHAEFDWPGTFDPTAWITAEAAFDLHEAEGGAELRAANHALVRRGREVVADLVGGRLPYPDDPALYGSMAAILLDGPPDAWSHIHDRLIDAHRVQVPIISWGGHLLVRISGFALYNRPDQYERLGHALRSVLDEVGRVR
jgi:isopenicillin-N epimerase